MSLDRNIVEEIAIELGTDPAFVEKDWYAVQVLKAISEHQSPSVTAIFSGGTSLSKGYGVIHRFSEDLDFRCRHEENLSGNQIKNIHSSYRTSILATLMTLDSIQINERSLQKTSLYTKFSLDYPRYFNDHSALRSGLEVEFSFTQPRLNPERKLIQSFVSQFSGTTPETSILCLSPIETAADKLSALTWRVLKRDRADPKDDPALMRHLHDLSALMPFITADQALFIETVQSSFAVDQKTSKRRIEHSLHDSMLNAHHQLTTDALYQTEYQRFVAAMSYADDDKKIEFKAAVNNLEVLIDLFKNL